MRRGQVGTIVEILASGTAFEAELRLNPAIAMDESMNRLSHVQSKSWFCMLSRQQPSKPFNINKNFKRMPEKCVKAHPSHSSNTLSNFSQTLRFCLLDFA
ncbi:MAG: hypothetical protein EDM05_024450 [Leptolyngbya sp. IPPAS B-1204]